MENSSQTVVADKPPPLLVGTLFYARRVIHVATTDKVTASAKVTFAEQLMKKLGLGSTFKASLGGGDLSNTTVDIVGTDAVPVAFAPAFVVIATKRLADGRTKYNIASVDQLGIDKKIREARQLDSKFRKFYTELAPWPGGMRPEFTFTLRTNRIGSDLSIAVDKQDVLKDLMGLHRL